MSRGDVICHPGFPQRDGLPTSGQHGLSGASVKPVHFLPAAPNKLIPATLAKHSMLIMVDEWGTSKMCSRCKIELCNLGNTIQDGIQDWNQRRGRYNVSVQGCWLVEERCLLDFALTESGATPGRLLAESNSPILPSAGEDVPRLRQHIPARHQCCAQHHQPGHYRNEGAAPPG